jgi:predicted Zn-ribbon and HTH transcriptional regulator
MRREIALMVMLMNREKAKQIYDRLRELRRLKTREGKKHKTPKGQMEMDLEE